MAVIQGLLAVVATVLVVEPLSNFNINWYYGPSRVIAGGGGGTWLFVGYISYLVVGVVATAVTAIFYFYIEGVRGKVYKGFSNLLAWGHLLLMNVGVAASMFLMMYGGYLAGYAAAPAAGGGLGYDTGQIHVQILSPLVQPIGLFILVGALGAVLGGLGFIVRSRGK